MNIVYNSEQFYIVEYPNMGFEIVDKISAKGGYVDGLIGIGFQQALMGLLQESQGSEEKVDEFLADYNWLTIQPVTVH